MNYICKQCGKEYTSRKKNSKYCSMKCRMESRKHYTLNCSNCDKPVDVIEWKYNKVISGDQKDFFCSKECTDKFHTQNLNGICLNCGTEFKSIKSVNQKFCCRKCYEEHKVKKCFQVCPVCSKTYKRKSTHQIFCSKECRGMADRKRVTFNCEYCNKESEQIISEYNKNKRHFCSSECKTNGLFWSENDENVLKDCFEKYGKIDYDIVIPLIDPKWNRDAIKRKSIYLGLTNDRSWSEEETKLLLKEYPCHNIKEMPDIIHGRSIPSIIGKARTLGLLSKYYTDHKFTDDEDEYIRNNYKSLTNEDIAKLLNRTTASITCRLNILGLRRGNERLDIDVELSKYLRYRIYTICEAYKKNANSICEITNKNCIVEFHHIKSFSCLVVETLEFLKYPLSIKFSELSEDEVNLITETFINMHESQKKYIVIDKNIHDRFHKIYSNGYNTEEQWEEFLKTLDL